MKKTDKYIEEQVGKTLKAFDKIERAKPRPFLYTRIQARLESKVGKTIKESSLSPVFQRFAIAMVLLVVVFNIYTATRFLLKPASTDTLSGSEQLFVEEYYPSTPTLYNITQLTANP